MTKDFDHPHEPDDSDVDENDPSEGITPRGDGSDDDSGHAEGSSPVDPPPELLELFGGSAELTALADEDANELLRFVESAMTEAEASEFLDRLESRDPLAAMRLRRMQEDHRLLRTTGEVPIGRDLLGPVRARVARGEIVADSNFAAGAAEPTQFMERSLESLARGRRWRAKRRPVQLLFAMLMITGIALAVVWGRGRLSENGWKLESTSDATVAERKTTSVLASFGLVVPVADAGRFETEIALVSIERGVVLVRNLRAPEPGDTVDQPPPIVGTIEDAPGNALRSALADRGFDYAFVVTRAEASAVLAEIGRVAAERDGRFLARLVSTDSTIDVDQTPDAWTSWSRQAEAIPTGVDSDDLVVVPLAMVPFNAG